MDGESYGYMKNIIEEAVAGNDEVFQPFVDRMAKRGDTVGIGDAEESEESEDFSLDTEAGEEDLES